MTEQIMEEPLPEKDGEAALLIQDIRKLAASLSDKHLESSTIDMLNRAVDRLVVIAELRKGKIEAALQLQSRLQAWQESHSGALTDAVPFGDRWEKLLAQTAAGDIDQDRLERVLCLFDAALNIENRAQEARTAYDHAIAEDDLTAVISSATALKSLEIESNTGYTAIDKALAGRLPHENQAPGMPLTRDEKAALGVDRNGSVEESAPTEQVPEADDDEAAGPGTLDTTLVTEAATSDDVEDISAERIEATVAAAIERGRFGLAYHLALASPEVLPSAKAIELVACNYVTDKRAPVDIYLPVIATELRDEAAAILNKAPNQLIQGSHAILVASAALVPARIAPGGPVAQLLLFLEPHIGDMPSLRALVKITAEVSMKGIYLPVELLREEDSLEKWDERRSDLRNETKSWIENERQAKLRFHAATRVWKRILTDWDNNDRASLGRMFELLIESVDSIDDRVGTIADHWRHRQTKEIDRIDREIRNTAAVKKIEGSVRSELLRKIDEAITFSDRWHTLIKARPDKRPEFHTRQANILRGAVDENAASALAEVGTLTTSTARRAEELIRRYVAMFKGSAIDEPTPSMSLPDLLNGDLLANPSIRFDATDRPSEIPVDVDLLLNLANQDKVDFKDAAIERARCGDFLGAEKTIDFAGRSSALGDDGADNARYMVEVERTRVQQEFKDKVGETSIRLDAAYARGVLSLETLEQLRDKIPSGDFCEIDQFEPRFEMLSRINGEIDDKIKEAQSVIRKEILQSLAKVKKTSQEEIRRVKTALDDDLFHVAEDFVERIEHGEELPKPEVEGYHPFDDFFPNFVEKFTAFREKKPAAFAQVRHAVENRVCVEPVDATRLSADAALDGTHILEAWEGLRDGQTSVDTLRTLVNALGFAHAEVMRETDSQMVGGEKVFRLQTTPVADRRVAQLPDFGSCAAGRYRLLTIRGRDTEEAIIREAGDRSADGLPPNIVLFLSVLDADSRRALAREFRSGRYHPTLVLDEALIVFLAAWSRDRFGAFFDCASAFAFAQPFDPDAAEVPPEMFFGRADERNAIVNMSGNMTHLVYGGRRLGKTALLASIAREYRTKAPDQLVLLIDLKGSGIGSNRPTGDLWRLFAERLVEHTIVTPQTVRPDSIGKDIKHWLKGGPGRRILLLVDEGDDFLEADRRPEQGYRVLEQIKRLMDETKRRFKVVFAGLHNVQRAARDPNTPFAHLGEPARIGPMLPEADGAEIENLIRGPVEALGYRFASTDSVIRIAAETNYYPALAQQFCKELLRNLHENGGMHGEEGPPYTITKDMVDHVFDSKETRDRIRNLFSWTIQLDPRFEFLTYLIARQSFDNDYVRPRPVAIADIRDTALNEWPSGFNSDSSYWMFEVLLEEMAGLGILREAGNKEYVIRTRNLRMLLGNDDQIERRFLDAKSRPAPPTFDPAQFRNTLDDKTPSSLTADQEHRLLSSRKVVGLVFGTRFAGLDRVGESLGALVAEKDIRFHDADLTSIDSLLKQVSRGRKAGIDIILIDMRKAWNLESVNETLALVSNHDAQKRIIRPVFLCGPNEAWEWLNGSRPARKADVHIQDIWLGPCAMDYARRWLRDREAPAYTCLENSDYSVDLPWPVVCGAAAKQKHPESMAAAVSLAVTDGDLVSDIFVTPEVKTLFRAWLDLSSSDDPLTADDLHVLSGLSQDTASEMSPEEAIRFFRLGWPSWSRTQGRSGLSPRFGLRGGPQSAVQGVSLHRYGLDMGRLPGPADFLDAIVEDLTDRSSVLLGLPDEAPATVIAVEIADAIKRSSLGRWAAVRSMEAYATTPLEFIARRFDHGDAGGFVLWVDAMSGDEAATAWTDYARRFSGLEKTPRICIAMSAARAEALREDKGIRRRLWQDFVTALDSRVLAERLGRRFGHSPAHIALKSALIAELAGPNLVSAERLAREPLKRLISAGDCPSERIWAAQVSVLFPLVEYERRRLLNVHRALWRLPHTRENGKKIQCLEDLEIRDMATQANWGGALYVERQRLDWLRRVRNYLAHNKIVPWSTLVSPLALQIIDFRR